MLKVLEGHTGDVTAVAVSADGSKIVSGSVDESVRVWSMETGQVDCCWVFGCSNERLVLSRHNSSGSMLIYKCIFGECFIS